MTCISTPTHTRKRKRNPTAEHARDAIVARIRWCVANGILEMPATQNTEGLAAHAQKISKNHSRATA